GDVRGRRTRAAPPEDVAAPSPCHPVTLSPCHLVTPLRLPLLLPPGRPRAARQPRGPGGDERPDRADRPRLGPAEAERPAARAAEAAAVLLAGCGRPRAARRRGHGPGRA